MRIVQYKNILNDDKKNTLIRESSKNYPGLNALDTPEDVCLLANAVLHGSDCAAVVTPRELFIRLLLCGAHAFFMVHNHPSGDITPSSEDDALTKRVIAAGKTLNVELLDHVIIADRKYYSYRESRGEWF